jgi:hypothetical protein
MLEFHAIQRDRYKAIAGVINACRNIGKFVNPLEQVAAKQRALIVHVFRVYEFAVIHYPVLRLADYQALAIIHLAGHLRAASSPRPIIAYQA